MFYLIAADFVVFLHFLWIVFLVIGAFIGRRYKWIKRLHVTGLAFAIVMQFFNWYCPLTYLEVWLRKKQDPSFGYSGSYIIYYLEKIVYLELPPKVILIMTVILILLSAWIYLHKKEGTRSL
jgi:predicted branched-subunit amino acid permease